MKTAKTKKTGTSFLYIKESIKGVFTKNYGILIVFALAFISCIVVSFFVISSSETVLSFTVSEYEVGQIADKTIIADVSLPPDARHPVSVEAGEKIVRKGFPVTEIGLAKL